MEHIKYPSQISDKAILKYFWYHLFKSHSSLLCLQWIQIFFNPPFSTNTPRKKYPTPNKLKKQLRTYEISVQRPKVPQNYEWENLNFMSSECMHKGRRTTMDEVFWNPQYLQRCWRTTKEILVLIILSYLLQQLTSNFISILQTQSYLCISTAKWRKWYIFPCYHIYCMGLHMWFMIAWVRFWQVDILILAFKRLGCS